jgi:hypothetical protein
VSAATLPGSIGLLNTLLTHTKAILLNGLLHVSSFYPLRAFSDVTDPASDLGGWGNLAGVQDPRSRSLSYTANEAHQTDSQESALPKESRLYLQVQVLQAVSDMQTECRRCDII